MDRGECEKLGGRWDNGCRLLSGAGEELRPSDYGKYEVPSDKIRVLDEPYEMFYTVENHEDALKFKRAFNYLQKKHLGVTSPIAIKRFIQNGVHYDIYWHRWVVVDDQGNRLEIGYGWKPNREREKRFFREVNQTLGKVFLED